MTQKEVDWFQIICWLLAGLSVVGAVNSYICERADLGLLLVSTFAFLLLTQFDELSKFNFLGVGMEKIKQAIDEQLRGFILNYCALTFETGLLAGRWGTSSRIENIQNNVLNLISSMYGDSVAKEIDFKHRAPLKALDIYYNALDGSTLPRDISTEGVKELEDIKKKRSFEPTEITNFLGKI